MTHLSENDIAAFRSNTLTPEALLALDRHVAQCTACRERLLPTAGSPAPFLTRLVDDHLTYEQLEACLDGVLDPNAVVHLGQCPQCRAELDDLRSFRDGLAKPVAALRPLVLPRPKLRQESWHWPSLLATAASLAALAAGLGWWFTRPPAMSLALHDAGGIIGLDKNKRLAGDRLPPQPFREAMSRALRTGSLDLPPALAGLRSRAGLLRGDTAGGQFQLVAPAGVVVEEARPLFRWEAAAGALSYRISVFDTDFREIAGSEAIVATEWTPTQPLPRGKQYRWQVEARLPRQTVVAPGPAGPPAIFLVLDEAQARAIEEARVTNPEAHLLLAILYARAGLLAEARREFTILASANPESRLPREWIETLSKP